MDWLLRVQIAVVTVALTAVVLIRVEAHPFRDACSKVELGAPLQLAKDKLEAAGGTHDQLGPHIHAFIRSAEHMQQRCVLKVDHDEEVFMVVYDERALGPSNLW